MIKESGGSLKVQKKLLCAMCYKEKERLQRNEKMTTKGEEKGQRGRGKKKRGTWDGGRRGIDRMRKRD
jgi:hypothetical protein